MSFAFDPKKQSEKKLGLLDLLKIKSQSVANPVLVKIAGSSTIPNDIVEYCNSVFDEVIRVDCYEQDLPDLDKDKTYLVLLENFDTLKFPRTMEYEQFLDKKLNNAWICATCQSDPWESTDVRFLTMFNKFQLFEEEHFND